MTKSMECMICKRYAPDGMVREDIQADWLFSKIIEMLQQHLKNFKDTRKWMIKEGMIK